MTTEPNNATAEKTGNDGHLSNKELNTIWLRWAFTHLASMSYEKLQGHAYAWAYLPFAEKYYKDDPEAKRRLLVRHSVFFNTEPQTGQLINGIVTSLEENIAMGGEVSEDMPNNIKATLMGPLAGIGDSIIQGIIVPILLSIGMSLATNGSPIGPLFYMIAYGIIGPLISFISYRTGYKLGVGAIDVIVVDSVAALVPRAEIEGEMGDSYVGLHARLMSQALRKLTGAVGKTNTIVIFINQLREKVGVMYGNPEVTTGGRALKFYASVRIDVRRIEALKNGGEVVGNRTRAKVVKNKVAPPFREAEFDIMYGEGIAHTGELIDLGVRLGIITKAGSWFSMGEVRIGQGRDAAKKYLEENPDIAADVEAQIRANFDKLMGNQSRIAAAKAAGKAVNVSADDFNDED